MDSVETGLKITGFRNLRPKSQHRDQQRAILEEAEVQEGLKKRKRRNNQPVAQKQKHSAMPQAAKTRQKI
jgi:hypothetical protein